MGLRTRQPTGLSAWPMILIDGIPKAGKSSMAYELSASPKIGRTFVFAMGERTVDEYKDLGPYEIIDLAGTWADFMDQLVEATRVPMVNNLPNVIVLDTATSLWMSLSDWAGERARSSRRAQQILKDDPDADIDVGSLYWNGAKDRWAHMMRVLTEWEGISVLIARGDEVTEFKNGQPVANSAVYRAQVEKTTLSNVTANIRLAEYRKPKLMVVTKMGVTIPSGGMPLPKENALEHLIFEVMGVTPENRQASKPVTVVSGGPGVMSEFDAKVAVANVFINAGFAKPEVKEPASAVWHLHFAVDAIVEEVPVELVDVMVQEAKDLLVLATPPAEPEPTTEPVAAAAEAPAQPTEPSPALDQAAQFLRDQGVPVPDVEPFDVGDEEPY